VCKTLAGNPEGRRPFRRPRLRWENNIKMDLNEIGFEESLVVPFRPHSVF
jgi:hypothetical protein